MRRTGASALASILVSAVLLLWPAALNSYPLVFGDTGVYLSDGIHLHASWPRPLFYGLFMLPLHMRTTLWPVIAAQAGIAAALLHLTLRCFLPGLAAWALIPVTAVLATCTSLPWFASQLMPDLFGALMLLSLAMLILTPQRLSPSLQVLLVLFAAGCITMHQSFLPTALACVVVLLLARAWQGDRVRLLDVVRGGFVPALALAAAIGANAVLAGQPSPSPYGKIFIMTRVIFDGPGQRVLQRECPRPDWSLCSVADAIPPTVELFLFGKQGTLNQVGGYQAVARQAWPIVMSALLAEPGPMLANSLRNAARQFISFETGDWLIMPMPSVVDAWKQELPPAEQSRYQDGKQYRLIPLIADALQAVHLGVGSVGLGVLAVGAVVALRQREALGGLYLAILAALVTNAVIVGALSGVYDRYQSRFMWLPTAAALLMLLAWWRKPLRERAAVSS